MKRKQNKQGKAKKIINIILDVFCIFLFIFAAYHLVLKFTNNSIYLFGVRSDVVLSDSMSFVSEDKKVQKFLQGHDERLKKGDLVYSTKVKDDTELNVYDIVIFKNMDNGKETIHRIVDIRAGSDYLDGKERYVIRADTAKFTETDGAYTRDQIIAKYKSRIGGIGHVYRFFSSIFGLILEVGLIFIVILYQYLDDKYYGSKKIEQTSSTNIVETDVKVVEPAPVQVVEEKPQESIDIKRDIPERSKETGRFVSKKKKDMPVRSKETGRFVSNKKK